MHRFPPETSLNIPERFTDPFRYSPHPLVSLAASMTMERISGSEELSSYFSEGKMLGILVVSNASGEIGYLAAFSGNAAGRSHLEGFVPPIYDLSDPSGHFKIKEAEITAINKAIHTLENSIAFNSLRQELAQAEIRRDEEVGLMKARMSISKRERDEIRSKTSDPSKLRALTRESQFEKAELRRLKLGWEENISTLKEDIRTILEELKRMKTRRAEMSDALQKWIFSQYIVHNALGESSSIGEIFDRSELIPPGGTGECAAPKLLEYAYRNNLRPIAMGEFWYGDSPATAVRTHGHFYPSCTSKCGPLLGYMLQGMELMKLEEIHGTPSVIYEDKDIVAVTKPSGMPSVPGLDGRLSAYEILCRSYEELHTVHRLDMDTSGIIIFAKTEEAAKKNYVLHILDNEGVKHPKFKYTGVKFARSVMPANLK